MQYAVAVLIVLAALLNRKEHLLIMAQIDDLNAGIADVSTKLTTVSTDVQTVIAELRAAEQSQGVDLSGPIAALATISGTLGTVDDALKAAIPAPPAPTTTISVS